MAHFVYKKIIHTHLSGTLKDYLYLSPASVLKYATVNWAKENGFELIHYGGGLSDSEDDSLLSFKKKFGQNTEFDYYKGKKIWDANIYNQLCVISKTIENKDFFPAYRCVT